MKFATTNVGGRITATKQCREALCPLCKHAVVSKCGKTVPPYWSHIASENCDPWREPETEWHHSWKNLFPEDWQEVVIGNHRADIKIPNGPVIEFQHSPIDVDTIKERESFYGNMVWLFDGKDFESRVNFTPCSQHHLRFEWDIARPSWLAIEKTLVIDFGKPYISKEHKLFCVQKMVPVPKTKKFVGIGSVIDRNQLTNNTKIRVEPVSCLCTLFSLNNKCLNCKFRKDKQRDHFAYNGGKHIQSGWWHVNCFDYGIS